MDNNTLEQALDELDSTLGEHQLTLDILICGAFAIQLLGYNRSLHTLDVDTVMEIKSTQILDLISKVGAKHGLSSNWLNDQAASVKAPEGLFQRAQKLDRWSALNAFVIDRVDLIKMKASAFSIRREETSKDWEDLKLLNPTKQEIEEAIDFLNASNSPPENASSDDINNFKETLHDLRSLVR